ncbi:MAG: hypothetical protein MJZ57_05820 [Bacteroidales bacterium]|nr:hypothetical protein [Bacteroidales bacterium]
MKKLISFYLVFVASVFATQGQSSDINDHERIFVLGIKHFEELVLVKSPLPDCRDYNCIMEKKFLPNQLHKDCDYYQNLWKFQPESYIILDDDYIIKKFVLPQISDSTILQILLEQFDSTGNIKYKINDFIQFPRKRYKNIYYKNISCHRYLAILIPLEIIIQNPRFESTRPKGKPINWGLYEKMIIPLPFGDIDTLYQEGNYAPKN